MEILKVPSLPLSRLGHCIGPFKIRSDSIFNLAIFCLSPSAGKLFQNCKSERSQASIMLVQLSYCESLTSYDQADLTKSEEQKRIWGMTL